MESTLTKKSLNGKDLDEVINVLKEPSPLMAAFPLLVTLGAYAQQSYVLGYVGLYIYIYIPLLCGC